MLQSMIGYGSTSFQIDELEIYGCYDSAACNYQPLLTELEDCEYLTVSLVEEVFFEDNQYFPVLIAYNDGLNSSYTWFEASEEISISNNIDKIQSINILDNRININTNSNDGIGGGYTIKLSKYPLIDKSITIGNFLSLITNTDSNIQFQRTDDLFFDIESDNVIIRCDNINLSIQILDNIKQYNNLILRKIQYTKADSSVHLYITALRS